RRPGRGHREAGAGREGHNPRRSRSMTDVASQGPAPSEADRPVLTNRQGHPVYDNQNQRTIGARGPATLENYQFLEKISHFDRDLVGNTLAVFFIRDAIKFPDVIHSLKPDPITFRQEPARIFDFMSQTPEALHMLVNLFSPRGIPSDYRHMQGFGVNTYRWVN